MATDILRGEGASDSEAAEVTGDVRIASASTSLPLPKIPASGTLGRKRDAVSQILKKELGDLAEDKRRLNEQRKAISAKMKKSNRRRRRLLKKLKTTPTEDLVLMIRARERDESMRQADEMAAELASSNS
jgi:hypothetical protein